MANTITNIKMTNRIRGLVSKRRKRYTKDGYNLDLAYIRPNLIAMGFPAEKLEGVYRNPIDEVCKFLEQKHPDVYKIYNLCSERSYDCNKFHSRVGNFGFDDHNPPNIELIQRFCNDVHDWLSADPNHVAAVHCKAGKGRTGTMICCFMLHDNLFQTAEEALRYYDEKRTHDNKGVTIPSQRRYVEYYARLLRSVKVYEPVKVRIVEITLSSPIILNSYQGSLHVCVTDTEGNKLHSLNIPDCKKSHATNADGCISIRLDECKLILGDIKVEFYCKNMMRKEKLFHFWFNTYFAMDLGEAQTDEHYVNYRFNKKELDNAHKDKQDKIYPPDFEVQLLLHKLPDGAYAGADIKKNTEETQTPSECSEASTCESSTEEEGIWESDSKQRQEVSVLCLQLSSVDVHRRMSHIPLSGGVLSLLSKNHPRRDST